MAMETILVVDNDPEYLQKCAGIILEKKNPTKIITATNGKMAVKLAAAENPDIILMSWQMPVMDGITAIRTIKKNPQLKDIPIIIATGHRNSSEDLELAFKAGASDFIRKPIDKVELLARLHCHLKVSNYIKSLKSKIFQKISEQEGRVNHENSRELARIIHFILNERKGIISKISDLRRNRQAEKEIIDLVSGSLSQNYKLFNHYNSESQHFVKEDEFIKRLIEKHPSLLPSDIQLCLMLKRNLPSKEIAALTFRCLNTVKVARSKLRNKLNLDYKENLVKYIVSI